MTNFVGSGGFGPVYKGYIDEKLRPGLKAQYVAVKSLDLDGSQGHREWLVSTNTITLVSEASIGFLCFLIPLLCVCVCVCVIPGGGHLPRATAAPQPR